MILKAIHELREEKQHAGKVGPQNLAPQKV